MTESSGTWLRNQALWNVLGTACGVLALAATVVFWLVDRERNSGRLEATILSQSDLLDSSTWTAADREQIRVVVGNNDVASYTTIALEFRNTGGRAITSSDFESSLEVEFSDTSRIIRSSIEGQSPISLQPLITQSKSKISLQPLLLNPGDRFVIAAGVASDVVGGARIKRVLGRIRDVPEITFNSLPVTREVHGFFLATLAVLLFTMLLNIATGILHGRARRAVGEARAVLSRAEVIETRVQGLLAGTKVSGSSDAD